MENSIKDLMNKANIKLLEQKDKLLIEAINEKVKLDNPIDLYCEFNRKFPRLLKQHNVESGEEDWYWNNGTETGLWLITFYNVMYDNWDACFVNFKIGFRYKY